MRPFLTWLLSSAAGGGFVDRRGEYATVWRNGNQSGLNNVRLTWNTLLGGSMEMFDDPNETIVVPSGAVLARAHAQTFNSGPGYIFQIRKNTVVDYPGAARADTNTDQNQSVIFTSIQQVSAGDAFDVFTPSTILTQTGTRDWFGLEILPADTVYALVTRSTNQAVSSGVAIHPNFDNEVHDPAGLHVANGNTLQSPGGLVRFRSQYTIDQNGEVYHYMRAATALGGSYLEFIGQGLHQTQNNGRHNSRNLSSIINSSVGQSFTAGLVCNNNATIIGGDHTWMELEVLPPDTKYVLLQMPSTQIRGPGFERVNFTNLIANTAGAGLTGDGGIIVPEGATRAKISFCAGTGDPACEFGGRLNGVVTRGMPYAVCNSNFDDSVASEGSWVPVVEGDVLDLGFFHSGFYTLTGGAAVWFQVEFNTDTPVEPVPHRYWSVLIHENWDGWQSCSIGELHFRETLGGPMLAGTYTGTNTHSSTNVNSLKDNSDATRWSTDGAAGTPFPVRVTIDLGAGNEKVINEIMIRSLNPAFGGGDPAFDGRWAPSALTVMSADDGATWLTEWAVPIVPAWGAPESRVFPRPGA